ncbi:serine/threonine protein kinase [Xylaria sp. FL1777]|nr:serine/threonine protein kinase [Xylaria sp. FL1777]
MAGLPPSKIQDQEIRLSKKKSLIIIAISTIFATAALLTLLLQVAAQYITAAYFKLDNNFALALVSQKIIEEGDDAYRPGGFHPVYIGDVFNDRYKVLNKIGYGSYSTVWLVKDLRSPTTNHCAFRAIKVLRAECYGTEHDIYEREILTHLRSGDKTLLGYDQIAHLVDDFEHEGPNGKHVCLVFEVYGETLRSFGAWFHESMIPTDVMRRFTIQLLLALDYAHDLNIIHTDIQPSNIFVKFRDYSMIESVYLKTATVPQQNKHDKKYHAIPSYPLRASYFNDSDSVLEFDIVLGDWGVSSWADKHLTENIQPVALRAPEVLIKAPWNKKTDFWNLGAVVLELYRAVRMFDGRVGPDGHYEVKEHLAEIVDSFGPFPKALLARGDPEIVGKIFDAEGKVKDRQPGSRPPLDSEAFLPGLDEDNKRKFVAFLHALMMIDPAKRLSPEDYLRLPWLNALR